MANWIAGAIKRPGAFKRKAKAAHASTAEFASRVSANPEDYSPRTRRQAALAKTLRALASKRS